MVCRYQNQMLDIDEESMRWDQMFDSKWTHGERDSRNSAIQSINHKNISRGRKKERQNRARYQSMRSKEGERERNK